jgi:hypothetical protein
MVTGMTSVTAAAVLAAALALGGLTMLRQAWRRGPVAAGPWRYAVLAGWGLVALGGALLALASRPVWGLSVAAVVVMALALTMVLGPVFRPGAWSPRAPRLEDREPAGQPAGFVSRTAARALGILVIGPALALAVAVAWRQAGPGGPADQLMGAATAAPLALAAVLVAVTASRRPWRANAVVLFATVLFAAAGAAARMTGA